MNLKELLKKTLNSLKVPNKKLLALCVPVVVLSSTVFTITDILQHNPFSLNDEFNCYHTDLLEGAKIVPDSNYNRSYIIGDSIYSEDYILEKFEESRKPAYYTQEYILEKLEESRQPAYVNEYDSNNVILLGTNLSYETPSVSYDDYLVEDIYVLDTPNEYEDYLVGETDILDNNLASTPNNLYEALNLNEYKVLGFIPLILFLLILNYILAVTICSIFKCYLYNFTLESVDRESDTKVTNLPAIIGAEFIASSVKVLALFLIGFSSLLTVAISPVFLPLFIISSVIITFLSVKLSGISYVYVTDKKLNSIEIIKKSWSLTYKNSIDILLAILMFLAIILLICSPLHLLVYISSFTNIKFYVTTVFIYYCLTGLIGIISYALFNIHLFKSIDNKKAL